MNKFDDKITEALKDFENKRIEDIEKDNSQHLFSKSFNEKMSKILGEKNILKPSFSWRRFTAIAAALALLFVGMSQVRKIFNSSVNNSKEVKTTSGYYLEDNSYNLDIEKIEPEAALQETESDLPDVKQEESISTDIDRGLILSEVSILKTDWIYREGVIWILDKTLEKVFVLDSNFAVDSRYYTEYSIEGLEAKSLFNDKDGVVLETSRDYIDISTKEKVDISGEFEGVSEKPSIKIVIDKTLYNLLD